MRKRFYIFTAAVLFTASVLSAQNNDFDMATVEDAYLNVEENVVIKEMIASDGRDGKLVALKYIQKAIETGKMNAETENALYALATVGLVKVIREGGRVINNYPDIRIKACELLGKTGSEGAKNVLMKVMYVDNEPSVVAAAVKSLAELGFNKDDETIDMINWINRKFDIVNPTSSLALEILNAYEKLAGKVENKKDMTDGIMRIATNYSYVTPVRNKALAILKSIKSGGKSKGK